MMEQKWDLQLFAEGGGEAAAGAAEGGGTAPAEQAVQEPALRPAEERQMRRSGMLKKQAAAPANAPAEQAAPESTQAGKGEAEGEKAAGDGKPDAKTGEKAAPADDAEFYEAMKKYPVQLERLVREVAANTQAAQQKAEQTAGGAEDTATLHSRAAAEARAEGSQSAAKGAQSAASGALPITGGVQIAAEKAQGGAAGAAEEAQAEGDDDFGLDPDQVAEMKFGIKWLGWAVGLLAAAALVSMAVFAAL